MLGHCASSHTVASLSPRICWKSSVYFSPCGARCRSHGGLLLLGSDASEGPSMLLGLGRAAAAAAAAAARCACCFCSCCCASGASEGSFSTASRTNSANASSVCASAVSGAAAAGVVLLRRGRLHNRLMQGPLSRHGSTKWLCSCVSPQCSRCCPCIAAHYRAVARCCDRCCNGYTVDEMGQLSRAMLHECGHVVLSTTAAALSSLEDRERTRRDSNAATAANLAQAARRRTAALSLAHSSAAVWHIPRAPRHHSLHFVDCARHVCQVVRAVRGHDHV